MRRKWTIGLVILTATALAVHGFGEANRRAGPGEAERDQGAPGEVVQPSADPGYTMHEWGTFTTFSGSDGVHLEFRPLDVNHQDLPEFVFDRFRQWGGAIFAKARVRAKVRMETPVIYFYTDRPRSVRVRVDFPQGLLTEFYPPVRGMGPKLDPKQALDQGEGIGDSWLDWGEVDLLPASVFRPDLEDQRLADWLQQRTLASIVPDGGGWSHYHYARDTDASMVHVQLPSAEGRPRAPQGSFIEKFLFYRGVGKFQLPVHVTWNDAGHPQISNRGQHPLRSMILLDVHGDELRMAVLPSLGADAAAELPEPRTATREQIAERVRLALVEEGLFAKEAAAMVRTWQDSWFTEDGMRLLYMVPAPVTDELLPLKIEPAPANSVRVLVGRMELLSPQDERKVMRMVADYLDARRDRDATCEKLRKQHGDQAQLPPEVPIPEGLLAMDRFAEPALVRVAALTAHTPRQDLHYEARRLLAMLKEPRS